MSRARLFLVSALALFAGSDGAALAQPAPSYEEPPQPTDAVVTSFHFGCLQDWEQVGRTRYFNMLGDLKETLAVANNPDGGVFPVGTIVQLMPTEAMVKRAAGTFPETDDWEYLKLKVSRTGHVEIVERGGAEVRNLAGGCAGCHATASQYDHVCTQGHGCAPLPGFIVKAALKAVEKDPRCPGRARTAP